SAGSIVPPPREKKRDALSRLFNPPSAESRPAGAPQPPRARTLVGRWKVHFTRGDDTPQAFSIEFRPDGTATQHGARILDCRYEFAAGKLTLKDEKTTLVADQVEWLDDDRFTAVSAGTKLTAERSADPISLIGKWKAALPDAPGKVPLILTFKRDNT